MKADDGEAENQRPVMTARTESRDEQTAVQQRESRQADIIRDLERLMRGAAAFSRRQEG